MITIAMGRSIRKHRISAGYSQDGLAILAGMTRMYISKLENDHCTPNLRQVVRIAIALEIDPCSLVRDALDTVHPQITSNALSFESLVS